MTPHMLHRKKSGSLLALPLLAIRNRQVWAHLTIPTLDANYGSIEGLHNTHFRSSKRVGGTKSFCDYLSI